MTLKREGVRNMFERKIHLGKGWGVLHVDIQNDFVSGSLAVKNGEQVIQPANNISTIALRRGVPIAASADWHPRQTTHFAEFGGKWPVHCVADTEGAAFDSRFKTDGLVVFHKGMSTKDDGYSPWEGKTAKGVSLDTFFKRRGVNKLVVDGLATDYCVRAGVLDALAKGYEVYVPKDAIQAVNLSANDGENAIAEMQAKGAHFVDSKRFARFF